MWYTGGQYYYSKIGYAKSVDGSIWMKYPSNPVLNVGQTGTWDSRFVSWCSLIDAGVINKMWYHGGIAYLEPRIGYAESDSRIPYLFVKNNTFVDKTDTLAAEINKDGIIYIVPEGTSIVVDSINKYKVESVDTLANAEVHIPLTDFSLGQYMVVAVSNTGFVSPYPFHFWVGDTTLPVLKVVEGTVRIGDSISVTSSKDGTVYLFKNPLQPDLSKIRDSNNFVDSLTVAADSLGKFPTTGLYDNYTYYLYAVDIYGQFSERGTVSIITGVEETADAVIHIYPNPVQDVLHINLSGKIGELQVFDISGKCLLQEQITGNENSVDVSCLEIGLYIVRLKYEKQIFTRKIVKY